MEYSADLDPVTDSTTVRTPLVTALADRIKLPVRREVLEKLAVEGMATTASVSTPFWYIMGVTRIAAEGGAERAYVKTYNDGLDPMYLVTEPNTKVGALE